MNALIRQLTQLDRRIIYLLLSAVLIVALIVGRPVTPVVLPSVQTLYDAVERAPAGPDDGNIIVVNATFSANTVGENGNQARAIIRHLMLRKKRFAIMSMDPVGATLGTTIATEMADRYGYVYGTDWIAFGYQYAPLPWYKAYPKDIPGTVKQDAVKQQDPKNFPIMAQVKTIEDVALHIEVTASASVFAWIQLVQPSTTPRLKIGYACTGVMATEAYQFLDSGQLIGMLPGLKGAADYETLVDNIESRLRPDLPQPVPSVHTIGLYRSARHLMYAQNIAHIVIIILIILGNVGMLLAGVLKSRAAKEETHGS